MNLLLYNTQAALVFRGWPSRFLPLLRVLKTCQNLSSPGLSGAAGSLPSAGGSLGGAFGSPAPPESVAGKPDKT